MSYRRIYATEAHKKLPKSVQRGALPNCNTALASPMLIALAEKTDSTMSLFTFVSSCSSFSFQQPGDRERAEQRVAVINASFPPRECGNGPRRHPSALHGRRCGLSNAREQSFRPSFGEASKNRPQTPHSTPWSLLVCLTVARHGKEGKGACKKPSATGKAP